jgi:hypothetical protein
MIEPNKMESLEDALTALLYQALITKDEKIKEYLTQTAISVASNLTEEAVNRSREYAMYRITS